MAQKRLSMRKIETLSLLWVEYRQAHPDGYGYSRFCHNYNQWAKQLKPMLRVSLAERETGTGQARSCSSTMPDRRCRW